MKLRYLLIPPLIGLLTFLPIFSSLLALPVKNSNAGIAHAAEGEDDLISLEDRLDENAGYNVQGLRDLDLLLNESNRLIIAPQDINAIKASKVDVRVTNYLTKLVTPEEMGGGGLSYVKVGRITKNYDTNGVGKFDRETLSAIEEDNQLVSAHASGQSADITEVGTVTCKLIYKRHVGGNTTKWQTARPVKVAWQSRDGISRIPTPTGASLIGVAGSMSAQSILTYLNDSGEMDAYIDYVRGLDFETIILYVGANVFLKNIAGSQIKTDPLAGNVLSAYGAQVLTDTVPGVPGGIIAANPTDNFQLAAGKARVEEGLGLLPGSLRSLGWNGILENSGKRAIEESFGLPTLYLETHSLAQMNDLDTVKGAYDNFNHPYQIKNATGGVSGLTNSLTASQGESRVDDGFNFPEGTVKKLQSGDAAGFRMAGVNPVATAFKLRDNQRDQLRESVTKGDTPDLNPSGFAVSNLLSNDGLVSLFSSTSAAQQLAVDELEELGYRLMIEALKRSSGSKYGGAVTQILNELTGSFDNTGSGEALAKIGALALGNESGLEANESKSLADKPKNDTGGKVATSVNSSLGLEGVNSITAADIQNIGSTGDYTVMAKIGGSEVDKAVGWNTGTAYAIYNDQKTLEQGFEEAFANALGEVLGLPKGSINFGDNPANSAAERVIETRLGLPAGTLSDSGTPQEILKKVGREKFREVFGTDDLEQESIYDVPSVANKLKLYDATLGLEPGSVRAFLEGSKQIGEILNEVIEQNVATLTAEKVWNYFDLGEQFQLSGEEFAGIVNVLVKDDAATLEQKQAALNSVYKIMGRTIDSKANFVVDGFLSYMTAPDEGAATQALLNQGVILLVKAVGVDVPGITVENLEQTAIDLNNAFYNGSGDLEDKRTELRDLSNKNASELSAAERERLAELRRDGALAAYTRGFDSLTDFFIEATGIPREFADDARAFITGDYKLGLAGASFSIWEDSVNPYLPDGSKLSYEEFRQTLDYNNQQQIDARVEKLLKESGSTDPSEAQRQELQRQARKELMDESKRKIEYRISDAFLRKIDSTIPVGFTEVMMSGSDEQRGELLENWAINQLDAKLKEIDPNYRTGSLYALYNGSAEDQERILISELLGRAGIELRIGPLSNEDTESYILYLTSPSSSRASYYTDPRYGSMWSSIDRWFGDLIGAGPLPSGLGKSLFYASQNNWDFSAELKDSDGKVLVSSLSSLGESYLALTISRWGDKAFNLPSGSVYRIYQATKAIADASRALAAARAAGDATKIAQSSKALSNAQASLTLLVITMALNACSVCQQAFASVDQALAAPPGFTNALVAGAIAMALGLGPVGLYIAAAIYLFGIYKAEYLCPVPPQDPYSLPTFDAAYDQSSFGYSLDPRAPPVSGSPAPGQNPFDWDDNIPFADGNNPELWMGWARYYTGRLLSKTLDIAQTLPRIDRPLQLITYRRANAEYFAIQRDSTNSQPLLEAVFSPAVKTNPRIGLGYSQASTKTTDWVHLTFGGYF